MGSIWGLYGALKVLKTGIFDFWGPTHPQMILKISLRDSTSKNTLYKILRKVSNYINGRHMGLQSMKYMGKIWGNFVNWLKVDEILLKSISNYFYRILQQKLGPGKWKPVKIKKIIFFAKKFPRISDFGNFLLKVVIMSTVLNIFIYFLLYSIRNGIILQIQSFPGKFFIKIVKNYRKYSKYEKI